MVTKDLGTLARAVREARVHRGWSQERLAVEAGVSRLSVQRCEDEKRRVSAPVARRLWMTLGLDPRRLAVLVGYVMDDELDMPVRVPPAFGPITVEAIGFLEDPNVPEVVVHEWVMMLRYLARRARSS